MNKPTVKAPPVRARKGEEFELRISVLEKLGDDTHVKHVTVHITDTSLSKAIISLLEESAGIDVAAAEDAAKLEYPETESDAA